MVSRKVAIVGAGVSGLATAKVFLSQGHEVTVFEQLSTLGGVWAPARHYPGVRLQIKRQCYSFSDFPMPSHYPQLPSGQQIFEYLDAYARHFNVLDSIRFKSQVLSIVPRPDRNIGWRVHVRKLADGDSSDSATDFDFVVVCNGLFSQPEIPEIAGREDFEGAGGIVLHSTQLRDTTQVVSRDVVVVGFGKSALDIAEAILVDARSSTLVFRRSLWKFPHRIWGRAHISHFILSRFTEIWFPHPEMGLPKRFLHTWLGWLVSLYWRLAERIIGGTVGLLAPELRPEIPLRQAAACLTLAADNMSAVRDGRIGLARGSVVRLASAGVELDSGQKIDAQAVILATGFRQECPFLDERERAALFDAAGAIRLFRFLVNPDIPAMGFNGYNGVGSCQLMAEVGACWLVRLMEGQVALPSREAMLTSVCEETELRSRLLSVKLRRGYYSTPFMFGYLDQLLRDLGLPPADRHKGLITRLFEPIEPSDYCDLLPPRVRSSGNLHCDISCDR
jgi:dimethylaniline monooxygenase (N-oxide forming)